MTKGIELTYWGHVFSKWFYWWYEWKFSMPNSFIFKVRDGNSIGFYTFSFVLKNGWKGLGFEGPYPVFFLWSTTSFEILFTSLTTLSIYLGSFLGDLVKSKGFFLAYLVSLDAGWLSKERSSFLTSLASSKSWDKDTLPAHLSNMSIEGSNIEV